MLPISMPLPLSVPHLWAWYDYETSMCHLSIHTARLYNCIVYFKLMVMVCLQYLEFQSLHRQYVI